MAYYRHFIIIYTVLVFILTFYDQTIVTVQKKKCLTQSLQFQYSNYSKAII